MTRLRDADQKADIVARVATGNETLSAIGADYGISGENARQLAKRAGVRLPRPTSCAVCGTALQIGTRGAVRLTCSNRCWRLLARVMRVTAQS